MSRLDEIYKQIATLQAEADAIIAKAKADSVAEILEKMAKAGVVVADLKSKKTAKTAGTGKKAPAKFKDPSTGKTWSGRGHKPAWVQESMRL